MAAEARVLDMTDVTDGGGYTRKNVDEGDYVATVTAVIEQKSKAGDDMWVYTISLDSVNRATYPLYMKLDAKNLWKLSKLFSAAGKPIPKKRGKVDPNAVVGKKIGVTMVDDEWNGKLNSNVDETFAASEVKGTPKSKPVQTSDDPWATEEVIGEEPSFTDPADEVVEDAPVADTFEDDDLVLDLGEE